MRLPPEPSPPVVFTIAGSDSIAGAGVGMDLKVLAALGVYGVCALTAVTAQNSQGVRAIWEVPADSVAAQVDAICEEIRPAAAKTGMLCSEAIVRVVADRLRRVEIGSYVLDPVIAARDGTPLLSSAGLQALKERLLPLARVMTPNLAEASALLGERVRTLEEARAAAAKLGALGCPWVLLKGGHLAGEPVDLLWHDGARQELPGARIPGGPFHGTGCALSAAIAAGLAKGQEPGQAILYAREFLRGLLESSLAIGKGSRLLNPKLRSETP